ncbi:hypothetical protein BVI434_800011 [Burkholderia vietnamiensis]|nr:hypothetical protein BVI434_800011 [Burkholderia vietnamiensis]
MGTGADGGRRCGDRQGGGGGAVKARGGWGSLASLEVKKPGTQA